MEHTPLPWKTVRNTRGHFAFVSMNESWGPLGEMIMSHPTYTPELQEANADFIVRAVNSHYKLLKAVKNLETVARSYLRYPLEGEEPGYDAKDVLAYCNEARKVAGEAEHGR